MKIIWKNAGGAQEQHQLIVKGGDGFKSADAAQERRQLFQSVAANCLDTENCLRCKCDRPIARSDRDKALASCALLLKKEAGVDDRHWRSSDDAHAADLRRRADKRLDWQHPHNFDDLSDRQSKGVCAGPA